jgi:hypothetical protein
MNSPIKRTIAAFVANLALFPLFASSAAVALECTRWGQRHWGQIGGLSAGAAALFGVVVVFLWIAFPRVAAPVQFAATSILLIGLVVGSRPEPRKMLHFLSSARGDEFLVIGAALFMCAALAITLVVSARAMTGRRAGRIKSKRNIG